MREHKDKKIKSKDEIISVNPPNISVNLPFWAFKRLTGMWNENIHEWNEK